MGASRWVVRVRAAAAAGAAALAMACTDGDRPPPAVTGPVARAPRPALADVDGNSRLVVEVEDDAAAKAVVSIISPELGDAAATFVLARAKDGLLYGAVSVPAGSARQLTVRTYDADGREAHAGVAAVDVGKTLTPQAELMLDPVGKHDDGVVGGAEARAFVGSYRVAMAPRRVEAKAGELVTVEARVFDPDGEPVPLAENEARWLLPDAGEAGGLTSEVGGGAALGRFTVLRPVGPAGFGVSFCFDIRDCRRTTVVAPGAGGSAGGIGTVGDNPDPIVQVDGSSSQTCARRAGGRSRCWPAGPYVAPVVLDAWSLGDVSAGGWGTPAGSFGCAIPAAGGGGARCWGANGYGQAGTGTTAAASFAAPMPVAGVGPTLVSVSAGGHHACGLTAAGEAYCWGQNYWGQLGQSTNTPLTSDTPLRVVGGLTFRQITAGEEHTCGLTTDGRAFCWGLAAGSGRLGSIESFTSCAVRDFTFRCVPAPDLVQGDHRFTTLSAGGVVTCGLTPEGVALCWGFATPRLILNEAAIPQRFGGDRTFTQIAAGFQHACALTADGEVYCWGSSGDGQLGNGAYGPWGFAYAGTRVVSFARYSAIGVGSRHSCAVVIGGRRLDCWGSNAYGQLGVGVADPTTSLPRPVVW